MRNHRKKRASALILCLIVTLIAFTLSVSLLLASQTGGRISAKRVNSELAFRIAEAGIHHATISLQENLGYSGEQNTPFGAGVLNITISTPPGNSNARQVVSKGTVTYAEGLTVSRTVSALVDLGKPPQVSYYSVVSKGPLSFSGNVSVTSSPLGGLGDIASNTSVSLNGHVQIGGSAYSAGGVSVGGASKVSGGIHQNYSPIIFPQLDYSSLQAKAAAIKITNGNVNVTGAGTTVISGLINGNLNLSGSGHVIIQSPVWVTGTVSFGGSGVVDGGTIVSVGDISATGQNTLSGNGTLALVTMGNVSLAGGASITGAVLAPNGTVSLHGHSSIIGTVAANNISSAGTPTFTRPTNFVWPSEFIPVKLGYYQE